MLLRTPSIQPTHRHSSTTCDQSTLGRPLAFFVVAEPELVLGEVVGIEPVAQLGRRREEPDVVRLHLHRGHRQTEFPISIRRSRILVAVEDDPANGNTRPKRTTSTRHVAMAMPNRRRRLTTTDRAQRSVQALVQDDRSGRDQQDQEPDTADQPDVALQPRDEAKDADRAVQADPAKERIVERIVPAVPASRTAGSRRMPRWPAGRSSTGR